MVKGVRLVNLDTEDWGDLFIGCAGGGDTQVVLPVGTAVGAGSLSEADVAAGTSLRLSVRGLLGGHSGINIGDDRGNAVILSARLADAAASAAAEAAEAAAGDASPLPLPPSFLVVTACGGDMTGLFGKLTDSFKGITDVPSAEAAVPGLKDLAGILEGYKATADKLPEAGKATVKEMVGTNLGTLQPIIDTVLAIPGVGDILRPIVEPMLKTLSAFGL